MTWKDWAWPVGIAVFAVGFGIAQGLEDGESASGVILIAVFLLVLVEAGMARHEGGGLLFGTKVPPALQMGFRLVCALFVGLSFALFGVDSGWSADSVAIAVVGTVLVTIVGLMWLGSYFSFEEGDVVVPVKGVEPAEAEPPEPSASSPPGRSIRWRYIALANFVIVAGAALALPFIWGESFSDMAFQVTVMLVAAVVSTVGTYVSVRQAKDPGVEW